MTNKKGLEGIVAAESSISSIINDTLTYRGYTIEELAAKATFEEVIYLLWYGKLPNNEELSELTKQLREEMMISLYFLEILKAFPNESNFMDILRTSISMLGLYDAETNDNSKEANIRKAIRLQAKIPTIVAAISRLKKGLSPIAPRENLSFSENFLFMLNNKIPNKIETEAMNKALILHADHELNASTFSSRVTVATLSDVYSGITSAIGTLKGPLHGGANEQVMIMLEKIKSVENVDKFVREKLNNKEKIMGIGHRVYKNGDPRAKILKEMSKEICEMTNNQHLYVMSDKIERIIESEKGLKPNVDFYSASMYHSLGIDKEVFTPIFAVSRTAGWLAHILEQYENNRLIRPRAEYIGKINQVYVPINERN